ncbi:TetR/AcrR family transcriptional regulator [Nocardioides marmoriginsengisoli]|uniref:TetR/AcrR family transcriptional regulator n=1 Tax=Nocardioides marmoriginsengisoli TaxID=661483 RepID=UPI00160FF6B6|nr:TetR/AcrR family transcriptional regulator [Nocardioides marmoriginsengisoli]
MSKSERTRQRILDSAARVFASKGFAGVSLRDIASAADTKAGSLYYHFASKDELVEAVLRHAIEEMHQHVRDAVDAAADEGAAGRLKAAISAHTESVMERTDYAKALLRISSQIPDDVRERHNKHARAYGEYWGQLFNDARDEGAIRVDLDLTLARLLVLGAMNWTVEWPASLWSPESITSTLNKIVFEGIGTDDVDEEAVRALH